MIIQIKRNKESENNNILITAITILLNSKTCSNTIYWVLVMCSKCSHQAMSRKRLQIDLGKQSCPVTEWLTSKVVKCFAAFTKERHPYTMRQITIYQYHGICRFILRKRYKWSTSYNMGLTSYNHV